jgi:ABC-type microcin C transport system permease subunit YejB
MELKRMSIFKKEEKENIQERIKQASAELETILQQELAEKQAKEESERKARQKQKAFENGCRTYGWDKPIMVRWIMMQKYIANNPLLTEKYTNEHGAIQIRTVTVEELIRRFRLEDLSEALTKLTNDKPLTKA